MTEATADVAPAPSRRVVDLDRVLGALFLACCAAYGLALAHPCDQAWRVVSGFASAGVGGIWGSFASSSPEPPAATRSAAWAPWNERTQRRAFAALILVLAAIAIWAWTGTPGPPPLGLPRLPWRTIFLAALWAFLAFACVSGLIRGAAPLTPTGVGGLARLGTTGVNVAGLVFLAYAWDRPGLREVAAVGVFWSNAIQLHRYRPALLAVLVGAWLGLIANAGLLNGLEKLAACSP